MKIVYVLDSLGTGGAERSTADLWYYLREKGIKVFVVALEHRKYGIEREILQAGFNVQFLKSKGIVSQSLEIRTIIRKLGPEIVHSVLFRSNIRVRFARLLTRFLHIESLVNCSYDPIRLKDPRIGYTSFYFYKYLDRLTARLTDRFLAITDSVKTHYYLKLRIPAAKLHVIYRGRRENPFLKQRNVLRSKYLQELGLPPETQIILNAGRQEFQKGHLVLLKAIQYVQGSIKSPVAFVFLGREGNSSQDIKAFLEKNKLVSKLYWLHHRHDVPEWMASADIFVFPSLYEGLGGALIEAQAASLPIICSDIPVLREVVARGKNALMFEVGSAEQLGNCLIRMLEGADKQAMGQYSLLNFREKFLLEHINSSTLQYYEQIIS